LAPADFDRHLSLGARRSFSGCSSGWGLGRGSDVQVVENGAVAVVRFSLVATTLVGNPGGGAEFGIVMSFVNWPWESAVAIPTLMSWIVISTSSLGRNPVP
jgi:hypothetical protein